MKRTFTAKILITVTVIVILHTVAATFVSKSVFGVANPFTSLYGVCKITFTMEME